MFAQLWHAGRTTHVAITGTEPVTASVDPAYAAASHVLVDTPEGFLPPSLHRALEKAEIPAVLTQYSQAALHAKKAGFDGIEIMAANGHLIDQFFTGQQQQADRFIRRFDREPHASSPRGRRDGGQCLAGGAGRGAPRAERNL
jgi:N-ethylmaleimide reductase